MEHTWLQGVKNNLKNIPGWRTKEKLIVIAVDDYGNVRLDSAQARESLASSGVAMPERFDRLDALETRDDLECLFDTLSSVTDGTGRPAVLTPYTLCANPDFEALTRSSGSYSYETLTDTFERLSATQAKAYDGTWNMWQEGIKSRLLKPQFHGREHLNVELIERKLRNKDHIVRLNIQNRSMVAVGAEASMPGVVFTHAFGLWDRSEIRRHREIIEDGLRLFESIFGVRSTSFTPPAQKLHPELFGFVEARHVRSIDKPRNCVRRLDRHTAVREKNRLGQRRGQQHITVVRNVVFEPCNDLHMDSVGLAMRQIAAAFLWEKPAIISSHRVNFSGHIDPRNRRQGLEKLTSLLKGIVSRWPDVQFIAVDELVDRIGFRPESDS